MVVYTKLYIQPLVCTTGCMYTCTYTCTYKGVVYTNGCIYMLKSNFDWLEIQIYNLNIRTLVGQQSITIIGQSVKTFIGRVLGVCREQEQLYTLLKLQ